jgi:hypothetical protein
MTKRITLCAASAAAGLAALIAVAGTADAAVSPNYARYCASQHPGSFVTTSNLTGEKLCTQRTYRGYGLRHYRINLALACRLTTGSTAYRKYGRGFVQCGTRRASVRPRAHISQRTPNLAGYCRRIYGYATASYSYRLRRWVCSKRTNNGLGLRHYTVNMARACYLSYRTTAVRYIGNDPRYPRCLVRG